MSDQQNTAADGGVATPASGRPAPDSRGGPDCGHWIGDERRHCREGKDTRPYLTGLRCPLHTPAALQGKPEPQPGPGWPLYRQEAK